MALRPVPWAIGNGAENSVELARAGVYVGSSAATGIIEPGDFRVTALPTPGAAVRVLKGTGVIKSTYPGVFGQSYVVQEQSFTDVPVTATGSSGGATKYVYVLINDTQYGGQTPPSVENGPYNDYVVSTTLPQNQPYLLVAKITQPASTATITGAMIEDVRKIANPKRESVTLGRPSVRADDGPESDVATRESDGGEYFPGGAGYFNVFRVDIPEWATQIKIRPEWFAVRYQASSNVWGTYWMEYGTEYREHTWPGKQQYEFSTQRFQFDSPGGNTMRTTWSLIDTKTIPAKLRGKQVDFVFKAALNAGSATGVTMDIRSGLGCELTFIQSPANDWEGAS